MDEVRTPSRFEQDVVAGRVTYDPNEDRWFTTTSWYPVDLDALLDGDDPDEHPTYFTRSDGQAILYPNRSHVFYGPSESLKSWAAVAASASVVEAGRSVFYVDFESDRREFVRRAGVVGIPDAVLRSDARPRLVYFNPSDPLGAGRSEKDVLGEGERYDPALVVLDGITDAYMLHGLDPMSARDVAEFHKRLLRRFPCATLGIDHTAKGRPNARSQSGTFGSQHKRAGVDVVFEFVPKEAQGRHGHSYADVYVTKDRPGLVRDIATPEKFVGRFHVDTSPQSGSSWGTPGEAVQLMAPPASGSAEAAAHDHAVQDRCDRVLAFVRLNPGVSANRIRSEVAGRAVDLDSALATLDGKLIENRGGALSKYFATEEDDE